MPNPPTALPDPKAITSLVLSRAGSCAILATGEGFCWGEWSGLGEVPNAIRLVPDLVEARVGVELFSDPSPYFQHMCARDRESRVYCWGNNSYRQLGIAADWNSATPELIEAVQGAEQLALGARHSCALRAGRVLCWGSNERGQAGAGPDVARVPLPSPVAGIEQVTAIAATDQNTCALTSAHQVFCWGDNLDGESDGREFEGPEGPPVIPRPLEIPAARDATAIAGSGSTLCAIVRNGEVICWGGAIHLRSENATSGLVESLDDATAISVGEYHACALRSDGTVACWGQNNFGEIGRDTQLQPSYVPMPVSLPGAATQVAVGYRTTCARLEDQRWFCWGANIFGEIAASEAHGLPPGPLDLNCVYHRSQYQRSISTDHGACPAGRAGPPTW